MTSETRHAIALIDDDKMILDTFQKRFEKKYAIFAFQSPHEFLKSLDKIKPFLFIVDWEMPEIDGLEVCRQIRKINAFDLVPVAFYTAKDPTRENVQAAYEAGAQLFIPKGLSKSFIELQINNLINSYKRSIHFLRIQKAMISVLKHSMASKLTGVTTAIEVLAMHPSFAGKELKDEIHAILESSNQIRILFEDLNETLVLTDAENRRDVACHGLSEIIEQAVSYARTDIRSRKISVVMKGKPSVFCNKRSLGRAIYYLVKFLDLNTPVKEEVTIEAAGEKPIFVTIYLNGLHGQKIESIIASMDDITGAAHMENLFYLQYSQNTLYLHDTLLSIVEEGGRTGIRFKL